MDKITENIINAKLDVAIHDIEVALDNIKGFNNALMYGNYSHAMGVYFGIIKVMEILDIEKMCERYSSDQMHIQELMERGDALYRTLKEMCT